MSKKVHKTPSQYKIAGHKISYSVSGAESGFHSARCACGWYVSGFITRKASAVAAAANHLEAVQQGKQEKVKGGHLVDWSVGDKSLPRHASQYRGAA